ncbi:MAG: hypothetical protein DRI23_03555 [Candidatus Cloacimonadota bacterium]|nr:MAG: hypothetical protein DRI23_03555 [Candidatus Cloacimonadota bacterium]
MIKNWRDRFSDNIKEFQGYSIGKIFKYLNNPEIISLAGGLPAPEMFQIHEMKLAAAQQMDKNGATIMQYTAVPGEQTLKDAIIDFLAKDGINITEDNLLITSSGQHGLDLTGRLFINPGDVVMLDRPTFAGAIVAYQMQRPDIIGIDLQDDGVNVEEYRQKIPELIEKGKKPKFIYVVPDFQNPSGITTSYKKRKALLEISYEFDIPIVEDSPYRDLRYKGVTIPSIFSLDQQNGGANVIGLYTFSKIFCPGIRVGFNIGPVDVISRMTNIKEANILNTPKFNQDMCTEFLTTMDYDKHINKCKNYYSEKLDVFLETMTEHFTPDMGVSWTKPEGGLFLWVTMPAHIDTNELFMEAIKYKVAFVPGEVFYGENPAKNHMRINFSFAGKEQLAEAVKRLAKCVKAQL